MFAQKFPPGIFIHSFSFILMASSLFPVQWQSCYPGVREIGTLSISSYSLARPRAQDHGRWNPHQKLDQHCKLRTLHNWFSVMPGSTLEMPEYEIKTQSKVTIA